MPHGSSAQANAISPRRSLRRISGDFLAGGAFYFTLSLVHAQSSAAPAIKIDTYSPNDNRWSVTITVLPSAVPQPFSTITSGDLEAMQQVDASYAAVLDRGSMLRDKQGEVEFVLYLNRASDFQREVYAYKVIENSYGAFNDLQGAINVRLLSTGAVLGTVIVPLHCGDGPPNALVAQGGSAPSTAQEQEISMGSEADFSRPASPRSFTSRGTFPNSCGLAWLDSTHLIVADQRNGSVTVLGAAGNTIYSTVLHQIRSLADPIGATTGRSPTPP